jgi:hypothetical protein
MNGGLKKKSLAGGYGAIKKQVFHFAKGLDK